MTTLLMILFMILQILGFILFCISIIFLKAVIKKRSIKGAIEYLKQRKINTKKQRKNTLSTFESDDKKAAVIKATTVARKLTKHESDYLSVDVRFFSSFFIVASVISFSVNVDRVIDIEMLNMSLYTWHISLFILLFATLTFFKASTEKKSGEILRLSGKAEIFSTPHIIFIGQYTVSLPKNWPVKHGQKVTVEGYEQSTGQVTALNMGSHSVDRLKLKSRGKWVMLSIFLFFNLFISGVVYDGVNSFNQALAINNISSQSTTITRYEALVTQHFSEGQYIQIKNIDTAIVNNTTEKFRVLLPDSQGIELDLSQIYDRLEKLKALQATLMFNKLKYYYMEDMDFSFSNDFNKSDFSLFLKNEYFIDALKQWDGYLNHELWVDMTQAEHDIDSFIKSQVSIIKNQLKTAIDEAIDANRVIKLYPTTPDHSFKLDKSQLYVKHFEDAFEPDFHLGAYQYIKALEGHFQQSEKISKNFFFNGYRDSDQPTQLNVNIIETERGLMIINYRAGVFVISLFLFIFSFATAIRIQKLNSKSKGL